MCMSLLYHRQAALAVQDEGATVAQLADRLGYRSEAAFARAFKRVIGTSPGAVKRRTDAVELRS
jgi:AraC-like DNA-binding protein